MDETQVLIVEDETIVALDIQKQLERNGYSVCGVNGKGESVVEKFDEYNPDIVLMDIQLQGDMDGVETAGILRQKYHVPVIFLTAYADDTTINRAKFIEPFGYITKPFEEKALRTTIEMALYKSKIDKELSESEERYRRFFEEDLSGTVIFMTDGTIEDCNAAFIDMFQFSSREEARDNNINDLFPDDESRSGFWKELKEKRQIQQREIEFITHQDHFIVVLANIIGTFENGELVEVKGYLLDISEKKELEKQLRHTQKMEAVGRLAGGIAHDFNNILTVMLGYSSVIQDKNFKDEDITSDLDSLRSSILRAVKLTKQLLIFSRRESLKPVVVDINDITGNLEKMLTRLLSENIHMQLYLDAEKKNILIDPGQLEQIIMNLVVNARDAMDYSGRIIIQTENIVFEKPVPAINGMITPGEYVRLSIADSGTGIDEKNLQKIFEPFFTTKPQEKGTGLGLSTVYSIVDQSEGFIKVDTEIGRGTEFMLFFKAQQAEAESDFFEEPVETPEEFGETVLLVEDDDTVRSITGSMLRRRGYKVLEAKNGGEAILLAEMQDENIHLLITDYILPLLNGDELSRRIRKLLPDIKTIIMTAEPDAENKIVCKDGDNFFIIKKPFEVSGFNDIVRKALEA